MLLRATGDDASWRPLTGGQKGAGGALTRIALSSVTIRLFNERVIAARLAGVAVSRMRRNMTGRGVAAAIVITCARALVRYVVDHNVHGVSFGFALSFRPIFAGSLIGKFCFYQTK
ncbi:hypothetical protein AB4Y32_07970 [Paraburkholderia phymatum]|uniref:Uncharacterized protein n=1 Tax=Paraburkholderia phymatum TaxID=148447 RepID=A0ACC6TWI6_9BURK